MWEPTFADVLKTLERWPPNKRKKKEINETKNNTFCVVNYEK